MESEDGRKVIAVLPPGAATRIDSTGIVCDFPMWSYWTRIGHRAALEAREYEETEGKIDQIAAALDGAGKLEADETDPGGAMRSTQGSMVAICASAMAIDGFYGTVTDLIEIPADARPKPGTARHTVILETLKHGFSIGRAQHLWRSPLAWLFRSRDAAVHHGTDLRPAVPIRETDRTIVLGPPELADYTPQNAECAVSLAIEVITTCLTSSKPATSIVAERYDAITPALLRGED